MACSEGSCFIGKTFPRRAAPRGLPGLPGVGTRRALPLGPSAVADDAVVIPEAPVDVSPAGEACDACGPSCRSCDPCREKYGHLDAPAAPAAGVAPEVYTVAMPLGRTTGRPARPAGAIVVARPRPRTWAELSPQERYAIAEQALDAAVDASSYARPAGNLEQLPQWSQMNEAERAQARRGDVTGAIAAMTRRLTGVSGFDSFTTPEGGENFDTRPEWAREAGIDLRTWTGMTPAAREEARQRHVAQSNQGWTLAGNIFNAASQITQSILGGNLQRDLAQIQAQAQTNSAAAQQAAAEFTARTNLQIAQMQLAAQQAAAQGNAGQAQQFQAAIAAMQAAQQEAQGRQESNLAAILGAMQQNQQRLSQPQGMSTGATLGLAAGVAALLAGGVYVATRKGK